VPVYQTSFELNASANSTFNIAQGWSTRTSGLATVKTFFGTFTGRECKRGGGTRGLRIARAFGSFSKAQGLRISSHQLIAMSISAGPAHAADAFQRASLAYTGR